MPGFNLEDYVPVNERLEKFRADHPSWSLVAAVLVDDGKRVLVSATIADETGRVLAAGHAEEVRGSSAVNRTSALENAETSAWGRALANLGYETDRGVASREEMAKVARMADRKPTPDDKARHPAAAKATVAQPAEPPDEGALPPDQQIARRAREVNVDGRALVLAVSKGRTASGKDLEAEEVRKALHAAMQLERGVWKLAGSDEDGWKFELTETKR